MGRSVWWLSLAALLASCGNAAADSVGGSRASGAANDPAPTAAPTTAARSSVPAPSTTVGATTASTSPATTASTTAPSTTGSPVPAAPADSAPADVVAGDELVGRWAHFDAVAYEDGVLKTLIVSYGFDDFTEVDGRIVDSTQFCFSEQRTDQPIETSLSDAATQAIRPPATPVEVDVVDGVLRIRRPATPTPVGIRLDDPARESLPTDPDDPRIVDDDGDGKPGITVTIRVTDELTGELYIARREIFAYEAMLVEPDLLTGTVTDRSEQLVIGASDPVFAGSGTSWVQHPDPTKSPIMLVRVDEDWDCDRLRAERDDLFPPTPDIDW